MWKYIFSALLVLPLVIQAQDVPPKKTAADTVKVPPKEKNRFLPTGLRVGVDALSLIRSQTSEKFTGWEVNSDLELNRYYLAFDYGKWSSQIPLKNGYYDNNGKYFRIGADVNFLLKDPDKNMLFLGVRFARSHFTDSASYTVPDASYDTLRTFAVNQGVDARWTEITGGLRVKIWKWLWMGYTARFKFSLKTEGDTFLKAYDVPGYGLTVKPNTWGFNYQIFIRVPLRKQK